MTERTIVDFKTVKNLKEFVNDAQSKIGNLEHALYQILEAKSLEAAKEIAADALDEDLETYLEDDDLDLPELDFSDDNFFLDDPFELDE